MYSYFEGANNIYNQHGNIRKFRLKLTCNTIVIHGHTALRLDLRNKNYNPRLRLQKSYFLIGGQILGIDYIFLKTPNSLST